jgi:hypothetical protein
VRRLFLQKRRRPSKTFQRIYGKGYLDLANRAHHFLGYVYDFLDRPKDKDDEGELGCFRVALEKLNHFQHLKVLK